MQVSGNQPNIAAQWRDLHLWHFGLCKKSNILQGKNLVSG